MERQHGVAESEKDRPNQKRSCPAQRSIARTAGERRRNAAEQAAQAKGADARGMTARRVVPLAPVPLGADQKTDRQGNAQPVDKVDSIDWDALIGYRNILPLSAWSRRHPHCLRQGVGFVKQREALTDPLDQRDGEPDFEGLDGWRLARRSGELGRNPRCSLGPQ
jgi:hypothetical protein